MNILLLGPHGQVGRALQRALAPLGHVWPVPRAGLITDAHGALCGDLRDLDGLAATVRTLRPRIIANAAAYTAVDKAEAEAELAQRINAQAPAVLAREAAACGALLLHYSTDYVFDGSGHTPWQESDPPAPLNVYGHSKLAGEQHIRASGCAHLILRTSWVYAAHGQNFLKTMLRMSQTRERLSVIHDQWGAPTGADLIADISAHALAQTLRRPEKAGLYHLAAAGHTTWYDYARYAIGRAGHWRPSAVQHWQPIASHEYPSAARRPHNSRLNTHKLQHTFGLHLPPWQHGVQQVLAQLLAPSHEGNP